MQKRDTSLELQYSTIAGKGPNNWLSATWCSTIRQLTPSLQVSSQSIGKSRSHLPSPSDRFKLSSTRYLCRYTSMGYLCYHTGRGIVAVACYPSSRIACAGSFAWRIRGYHSGEIKKKPSLHTVRHMQSFMSTFGNARCMYAGCNVCSRNLMAFAANEGLVYTDATCVEHLPTCTLHIRFLG